MPRHPDIHSVLVVGSGPIVIGQACEFDYSGTQACQALKEEGCRVILVNSNPATIMTDPELADATYVEPITPEILESIIEREQPDAILPTVGGQTALDLVMQLHRSGSLERLGVRLIGARPEAIERAEDRELFHHTMQDAGIQTAKGGFARTLEEALEIVKGTGFPAIIRPSYTLGGTGGGIAKDLESFRAAAAAGLQASPITEILVEESLLGWKEFELEVVRDQADNAIIVCSIENLDPMGVHTGDSITVAPAMTLSDRVYQKLRVQALACMRAVGVDTGGSNVQFAVEPQTDRVVIIEMNPRVSRSSALASKATGFPIARVAARLALGYTLDELRNDIVGSTSAAFEPTLDYVVVKIPRFDFSKFPYTAGILGVQMQSVGEVMAIGSCFREALQKAFWGMETGRAGAVPLPCPVELETLAEPRPERLLHVLGALAAGHSVDLIHGITRIDPWFLHQLRSLSELEPTLEERGLRELKRLGFSDERIAAGLGMETQQVRARRLELGIVPVIKEVDSCAAELQARTAYVYATYAREEEVEPLSGSKVMILGGGPNRIGQGIEFDTCCVHAVQELRARGFKTLMVNCNPETVSTDFDLADRLYFEPLTLERVLDIYEHERPDGVLVQFGGQTPLNLAAELKAAGVPIWGTSPEAIALAEDREQFAQLVDRLGLVSPSSAFVHSHDEAVRAAEEVGFPLLLRPSFVLGGRRMEILYSQETLQASLSKLEEDQVGYPLLLDAFLEGAQEIDVEALCDEEEVWVGGILQHIEAAGVHSGDSSCIMPPFTLLPAQLEEVRALTRKLGLGLGVRGLMNVQLALHQGQFHILEVNPRASRTVPFVSKVTGVPMARLAAAIAAGQTLQELKPQAASHTMIAVKRPVFPFDRFPELGGFLSPEMRSTGEVMGLDVDSGAAFAKAVLGARDPVPLSGRVFLSVNDRDKPAVFALARDFIELGFSIVATEGTARALEGCGIVAERVRKASEEAPHILDAISQGRIQLVVHTPKGERARQDERQLGATAIRHKVPVVTTLAGAGAIVRVIRRMKGGTLSVRTLQEIHGAGA